MGYVKRKGIILSPLVIFFTAIILAIFQMRTDWDRHFAVLQQYDLLTSPIVSPRITVVGGFLLLSLVTAILWYILGKLLAPIFSGYLSTFFGGIASQTFIDVNVNKNRMSFVKFLSIVINSILILFSLDLFVSNSFLYIKGNLPSFTGFLIALVVLSIFQPLHLIYDGIGVRSYHKGNAEITGISSVLDRFIFRLLSTGGLLGAFVNISLNSDIIDEIPVSIRIIFVRSSTIGLMIMTWYFLLFQPEGIVKDWKDKKIKSGKLK